MPLPRNLSTFLSPGHCLLYIQAEGCNFPLDQIETMWEKLHQRDYLLRIHAVKRGKEARFTKTRRSALPIGVVSCDIAIDVIIAKMWSVSTKKHYGKNWRVLAEDTCRSMNAFVDGFLPYQFVDGALQFLGEK